MKKTDNRTVAKRAWKSFLAFSKLTSGADGATLHAALISERSLGQNETVFPTGDTMGDRLERFFDDIFVVEPPAPVLYTLEELQEFFRKAVRVIANKHDAADYRKLTKLTDLEKALKEYQSFDTYPWVDRRALI